MSFLLSQKVFPALPGRSLMRTGASIVRLITACPLINGSYMLFHFWLE